MDPKQATWQVRNKNENYKSNFHLSKLLVNFIYREKKKTFINNQQS